jgi:hypothetical protein
MSSCKSGSATAGENVAKRQRKFIRLGENMEVITRMEGGQSRPVDPDNPVRAFLSSVTPTRIDTYNLLQNKCDINPCVKCLCLKSINVLYYFMKESLNSCIPGTDSIEIQLRYNSTFIYADSIYAGISRNVSPT